MPTLFDITPPVDAMRFGGATFDPAKDQQRLGKQFLAVRDLMRDGVKRTLREIADAVGSPEASVSARLRDMRKPEFGGYTVKRERRATSPGTWEYWVVIP